MAKNEDKENGGVTTAPPDENETARKAEAAEKAKKAKDKKTVAAQMKRYREDSKKFDNMLRRQEADRIAALRRGDNPHAVGCPAASNADGACTCGYVEQE